MIYIARSREKENLYKVGFSRYPESRIKTYSSYCKSWFDHVRIFELKFCKGNGPEKDIHIALRDYRATDLPKKFGREVYYGEYEVMEKIILLEIERYAFKMKDEELEENRKKAALANPKFIALNSWGHAEVFGTEEELFGFAADDDEYKFYSIEPINIVYDFKIEKK